MPAKLIGAAPAYDAAEKGTLDKVTVFPVEKKDVGYPLDEKKGDIAILTPPPPKDPYAGMKSTGKRQKATKLTLFKLWYNTYRWVGLCLDRS